MAAILEISNNWRLGFTNLEALMYIIVITLVLLVIVALAIHTSRRLDAFEEEHGQITIYYGHQNENGELYKKLNKGSSTQVLELSISHDVSGHDSFPRVSEKLYALVPPVLLEMKKPIRHALLNEAIHRFGYGDPKITLIKRITLG